MIQSQLAIRAMSSSKLPMVRSFAALAEKKGCGPGLFQAFHRGQNELVALGLGSIGRSAGGDNIEQHRWNAGVSAMRGDA